MQRLSNTELDLSGKQRKVLIVSINQSELGIVRSKQIRGCKSVMKLSAKGETVTDVDAK